MQVVEQHCIGKNDPRYEAIDAACFASKNLYNAATYLVRQAFIFEGTYLGYTQVFHLVKHTPQYKALLTGVRSRASTNSITSAKQSYSPSSKTHASRPVWNA